MSSKYNKKLAKEWLEWVENSSDPREFTIFPYIKSWIKMVKPSSLVDIGCGQGSCSKLIDRNISYIGVDASETLIDRAKEIFLEDNKKFILDDAYYTSLKDDSMDSSISIWVWSHLESLNLAAKEVFRILKNKGRFLLITAHPKTYEERKTFYSKYEIKGNLLTGDFDLDNGKYLTDTTLYLHTEKEIQDALLSAGFKIDKITGLSNDLYIVIECSK